MCTISGGEKPLSIRTKRKSCSTRDKNVQVIISKEKKVATEKQPARLVAEIGPARQVPCRAVNFVFAFFPLPNISFLLFSCKTRICLPRPSVRLSLPSNEFMQCKSDPSTLPRRSHSPGGLLHAAGRHPSMDGS